MQSVSDNIMLGQLAPVGTGAFDLLLDDKALMDAIDVSLMEDAILAGMTPGVLCCWSLDVGHALICSNLTRKVPVITAAGLRLSARSICIYLFLGIYLFLISSAAA